MDTTTVVFSSQTLWSSPSSPGLIQRVNAGLEPLLNIDINSFSFIARDTQRRSGLYLDVVLAYTERPAGDPPLTHPFVFQGAFGRTAQEAVGSLEAFKAENPGWWFSNIQVVFADSISGQVAKPYVGWLVASEDPNAGDHWLASGGGGGGGGDVDRAAVTIVGDGAVDTFAVSHNLAQIWPSGVSVWDKTSGELVTPDVIASVNPNTISIQFSSPVPNGQEYEVVVTS